MNTFDYIQSDDFASQWEEEQAALQEVFSEEE